jgi:hypothetical protein
MWGLAAVLFIVGVTGPRYGALLFHLGLLVTQMTVPFAFGIWLLMTFLRRKLPPGVRPKELVEKYEYWHPLGGLRQAAWAIFFIGQTLVIMCMGALIGLLFTYLFWRLTGAAMSLG